MTLKRLFSLVLIKSAYLLDILMFFLKFYLLLIYNIFHLFSDYINIDFNYYLTLEVRNKRNNKIHSCKNVKYFLKKITTSYLLEFVMINKFF